jgi:hypothetical protein
MKKNLMTGIAFASLVFAAQGNAAISKQEADRLNADLTPMGAERAGNAAGTIPAWTGEPIKAPDGYDPATTGHHPDPFADDKRLFTIDASNVAQYADQLTEGQQALFKSYPDTFKMHIYPSHRSTNYPKWLEENTYKVSQTAEMEADGNGVNNARAAVPFPIPKTGLEVVWNHLLRFQGVYRQSDYVQVTPDIKGRYSVDKVTHYDYFPYYDPNREDDGMLMMFIANQTAPAAVAGDSFLFHDYINPKKNPRNIWRYFSGQRRVRRAPVFVYDTPIPPSYGYRTIDAFDVFFGSPDKYNWTLVGKKEVYVPYNNYHLQSPDLTVKEIATPFHINPEHARYELHRVWEVVGELKDGQRHIYKKRKFYVDEDSWNITVADLYDDRDELWRVTFSYLKNFWEVPVTWTALEVHHDLIARRYNALPFMNEAKRTHDFSKTPPKDSFFTPASLRRLGAR